MADRYDFDMELYFTLREGLGRKSTWAHGVGIFGELAKLIFRQLGREDSLRFFRCVQAAARREGDPRPRRRLPGNHLSEALCEEFGEGENESLDAAWHLYWAARRTAGREQAELVTHCVLAALEADLVAAV
ncbi:hypothetical protein [Streptomyces sp. NPDC057557]|uniref:hypothetical protein n=1 Tax=Streptomyces sp. NPDC057557 TaxID=3346167 RepID=UPI00368E1ED7